MSSAAASTVAFMPRHDSAISYITRATAGGGLCMVRPKSKSKCNTVCIIVLACVLGGCALIALLVLLWCCLVGRRRRERRLKAEEVQERDSTNDGVLYAGEEESSTHKHSAMVPPSAIVEKDVSHSDFSMNPLAPTAPSNASSPHSAVKKQDESPESSFATETSSICTEMHVPRTRSTRIPIDEDHVTPLSKAQLPPTPPKPDQEATPLPVQGTTDASQQPPSSKARRRTRARGKKGISGVDAAVCPEDSFGSLQDYMA
ncbi:hypothetical protein NESM_000877800 [Novymonas esmeraldas]|uniref:Uncharacterized protein n=1 Tax=Novymonas esmeraldas TaxID=1808958 RepID=A0AAW0EY67_9TRYP